MNPPAPRRSVAIIQNLTAGLTVSFVAISLGAAFGELSGRGAFAGILSAGVIAFIAALFGGTRIQCSGPTAPMTAVTLVIVLYATENFSQVADVDTDRFINMVFVLTGAIIVLAAVLRLGRFIRLVPKTVISGFMNGIAILIWIGQFGKLFGVDRITGPVMLNVLVAVSTLVLMFVVPMLVKRYAQKCRLLFPGTIVAIVVMTAVVHGAGWGDVIETIKLKGGLASFGDLKTLVQAQFPSQWSWKLVWIGLPFAASLAMLAYLDSLLTALVVDKKLQEKVGGSERTNQNRELAAQGIANAAVSLFGGIPGAQATIRSVLIINENATLRLASVSVGLFVVVEMVLFQGYLTLIPSAVFTGILFKVGYDVFDWPPLLTYLRGMSGAGSAERSSQEERRGLQVTLIDILFIVGTTAITVFANLNIAVVSFTVLFYLLRLIMRVPDLHVAGEEAGGDTPQESTES